MSEKCYLFVDIVKVFRFYSLYVCSQPLYYGLYEKIHYLSIENSRLVALD